MTAAHPLLEKAAQHTARARAINDEFEGKDMPTEAAHTMEQHLAKASEYRRRVSREAVLSDNEEWLEEPNYKHDMSGIDAGNAGAEGKLTEFGKGSALLPSEKKEREMAAFLDFVRKGDAMSREYKDDLVSDATGDNLVPVDYAGTIVKDMARDAVIRTLAFVRPTSSKFVDVGSVLINTVGWGKLETGATATDGLGSPPADKDTIEVFDLNALVKLGRDELEDNDDNLAAIIQSELGRKLAEVEDDAFANGSGSGQPTGFADNTGSTTAAAAGEVLVADDLKGLKYRVPAWARRNAVYLAHSDAEEQATLLKDSNGNYLWQPAVSADEPPTFAGKRWYTLDGLPAPDTTVDAGAGTDPSIVFGDLRAGYMIADRRRLTVQRLNELYAGEGKIGLLFTHRVGGGVIRPNALAAHLL